jgi:hypothetical protein
MRSYRDEARRGRAFAGLLRDTSANNSTPIERQKRADFTLPFFSLFNFAKALENTKFLCYNSRIIPMEEMQDDSNTENQLYV